MVTTPHRTSRLLLLALVALSVACGRRATPPPEPTPTWWTAGVAPSATMAPTDTPTPQAAGPNAAHPAASSPRPSATPLSQPGVAGAYVTSYLPGWGERPTGIAVLGERVYVANQDTHNVSIIAEDGVERVVPVGTYPGATAADPASGRVFVLNHLDSTISVIEGIRVVATWALPEACSALAVAGGRLWVGATQGGRIHLLATDDGSRLGTATLDTSSNVIAIVPSPDETIMYVATYNRTTALDTAALSELARAELSSFSTLAISPDGGRVYVNDYSAEESATYLVSLDASTLEEVARLPVPPDPAQAITDLAGDRIYLASPYANALLVIDGATMELTETIPVGLDPHVLAMDPTSRRLFVANQQGDSVTVIDGERLEVLDTMPLAAHVEAMAIHPEDGTLYAAVSSSDRVLAFGEGGLQSEWYVGRHPSGVAVLPDRDQVAVLLRAEARLVLLDRAGRVVADYATGRNPIGLTVDAVEGRLYAGDLMVDLTTGLTETVHVETVVGSEELPVRVTVDTRRGVAYAVAFNGVPGTNGGSVAARIMDGVADQGGRGPGRVGVGQLIYDAEADRFYATVARLSDYGLQVSDAETLRELYYLPLDRRASAAALNGDTQHLWLALPSPDDAATADTRLVALDTRVLGTAAEIAIDGRVRSLAIDPRTNLVYAGVDGTGDVVIVQDLAMPAPPQPAALETPPPAATTAPEPTAAATPVPAATQVATATPDATATPTLTPTADLSCLEDVDEGFRDIWQHGGSEELGCPTGPAVAGDWARQPFEHGEMVWRGADGTIHVFLDDGSYRSAADAWREAMPELSCEAAPPDGLVQPIRGFGRVWCLEEGVRDAVGWAVERESAATGGFQPFENGAILRVEGVDRLVVCQVGAECRWDPAPAAE